MHDGSPNDTALLYASTPREMPGVRPKLHRWSCAWLRGRCGRLGRYPLAWSLGLVPTWRPQEAAAEEIEARSAKHVALQHLQAVDVPLDRAGTPGQGDAGFDRCIPLQRHLDLTQQ